MNTGAGPQAVGGAELGGLVSCEGRMVTRVSRGGGRRVSAAAFVRNMKHLSRGQGLLLMVAITFHSAQLGSARPSQAAGHLGTYSCVLSRCRLCGLDSSKWGQYLDDIYLDRPPAVFAAQFPR